MGMRSLVSNIVTEDYVVYAELAGVDRRRILSLLRHAQRAGAAGHRPRHVARRASSTAPSSPSRCSAIPASARCWSIGRLCRRLQPGARRHHGLDHRASRSAVLLIDLALSAARSARAGALSDAGRSCATSCATTAEFAHRRRPARPSSSGCRCLSFFSPYPPHRHLSSCRPTCRRRWAYPFGTTSRGQDVFWQLTFAIRNTLLFGIVVAAAEPDPVARRSGWSPATRAAGSTAC